MNNKYIRRIFIAVLFVPFMIVAAAFGAVVGSLNTIEETFRMIKDSW